MKTPTKYGLIAGILAGSWLIGEHFWELRTPGVATFAGYVGNFVFFTFIFISIWTVREKELGGSIDFKTAMRTGVLTSVYYALALGLFTFVNYTFINTDFASHTANAANDGVGNAKSTGSIIQGVILIIPYTILFGTVISVVISLLMRREKS